MSGTAMRATLAAAIAAVLPDGWTVYAAPPEVPSLPSVVLVPRSSYRTAGPAWCAEQLSLEVRLLEARSTAPASLDALDDLADVVLDACLAAAVGTIYESTELGNLTVWSGVETVDARLLLTVHSPLGGP